MSISFKRRKDNIALVKREFIKREKTTRIPFTIEEVMNVVNARFNLNPTLMDMVDASWHLPCDTCGSYEHNACMKNEITFGNGVLSNV